MRRKLNDNSKEVEQYSTKSQKQSVFICTCVCIEWSQPNRMRKHANVQIVDYIV